LHEVGCLSDSSLKGFFHQSDARLVEPDEVRERQRVVSSVFYGYSPELLAEWCFVTVETAKRWKASESSPPPPALRLFELHRDRKVLTSPAWNGRHETGTRFERRMRACTSKEPRSLNRGRWPSMLRRFGGVSFLTSWSRNAGVNF
jgi:hypothetical protein